MKIQRLMKFVKIVRDVLHSGSTSSQDQDLNEYEKVKREHKNIKVKNLRTPRDDNRDVSAI